MRQPPDKIETPLVPNDDADDPKIMPAVWEWIRRQAEAEGIEVGEPGQIDPAAKENPERQRQLVEQTNPELAKASARLKRVKVTWEHRAPSGAMTKLILQIKEVSWRLSVNLMQLNDLVGGLQSGAKTAGEFVLGIAGRIAWGKSPDSEKQVSALSGEPDHQVHGQGGNG